MSSTPTLDRFPAEILEQVFTALHPKRSFSKVYWPDWKDAYKLRLVCYRFDEIGSRVIFHTLRIGLCDSMKDREYRHLEHWRILAYTFLDPDRRRARRLCGVVRHVDLHVNLNLYDEYFPKGDYDYRHGLDIIKNECRSARRYFLNREGSDLIPAVDLAFVKVFARTATNPDGTLHGSPRAVDSSEDFTVQVPNNNLDCVLFARFVIAFINLQSIKVATFFDETPTINSVTMGNPKKRRGLPLWHLKTTYGAGCRYPTDTDEGFGLGTGLEQFSGMPVMQRHTALEYVRLMYSKYIDMTIMALEYRNRLLARKPGDEGQQRLERLDNLQVMLWPAQRHGLKLEPLRHLNLALTQIKHFSCSLDCDWPAHQVWEAFRPIVLYPMYRRLETLKIGYARFTNWKVAFRDDDEQDHPPWLLSNSYNTGIRRSDDSLFARIKRLPRLRGKSHWWCYREDVLPLHLLFLPLRSFDEIIPVQLGSESGWSDADHAMNNDDNVLDFTLVEGRGNYGKMAFNRHKPIALKERRWRRGAGALDVDRTAQPTFPRLRHLHLRPWQELEESHLTNLILRHRQQGTKLRHVQVEAMCVPRLDRDPEASQGDWNRVFERIQTKVLNNRSPWDPPFTIDGADLYRNTIWIDKDLLHPDIPRLLLDLVYPESWDELPTGNGAWTFETKWHRWPKDALPRLRSSPTLRIPDVFLLVHTYHQWQAEDIDFSDPSTVSTEVASDTEMLQEQELQTG